MSIKDSLVGIIKKWFNVSITGSIFNRLLIIFLLAFVLSWAIPINSNDQSKILTAIGALVLPLLGVNIGFNIYKRRGEEEVIEAERRYLKNPFFHGSAILLFSLVMYIFINVGLVSQFYSILVWASLLVIIEMILSAYIIINP